MATRTPPKASDFKREPYQEKPFSRATTTAPQWAFGCELCQYGRQADGQFCTCQAGQARARWASGNMASLEDEIHVPTFNAAYGGVE